MNNKLNQYFIDLIKVMRKKRGLSLENISSIILIDKGYLSKIENKIVEPSMKILADILNELGVEFHYDEILLNEMNVRLDNLYYDLVYLKSINRELIYKEIFSKEKMYEYSFLVDKYLIIKYVYLVTTGTQAENLVELEKKIEMKFLRFNLIDSNLIQIYYDYKGISLKNIHQLEEATEYFEKSKSLGYFKYSYGMVCYHLAMIYSRQSNYLEAYNNAKESLTIFLQEMNFNRQKYSQIHLANI